jgi:tRNA(Ile)-lysidine synthase
MSVVSKVEAFLKTFCPSSSPLLLALSGGPDSLCLFYCLLAYRRRHGVPFHIAHVDHGWRPESQAEAQALQQLAHQYQIPFHLKKLDLTGLKGNLEAISREERYAFFAAISQQMKCQAVLTGHHQDDQAETVFKRILEGAHWSRWVGLKAENWINGVRIVRPLLGTSRKEIEQMLAQQERQGFEDPTNRHLQFLRARLRETIFPKLNQEFGKQVQKSFVEIGEEAQELVDYFESRLAPLLSQMRQGPWGMYLDLQANLPESLLEIKYLLRLVCAKLGFFLSRVIIEQAAIALQMGKADQCFVMGIRQIWVDRRRIFILHAPLPIQEAGQLREISLESGCCFLGNWKGRMEEDIYFSSHRTTSWKEGWQGEVRTYLPLGSYRLGFIEQLNDKRSHLLAIKKRWTQNKVPAFLSAYFPLVWETETGICHEFLTGKPMVFLKEGMPCWRIDLTYLPREGLIE